MGNYIALELINEMKKKNIQIKGAKILIMGLTFKENCPDIRNSLVFEIISKLYAKKFIIDTIDPYINKKDIIDIRFNVIKKPKKNKYDVILLTVAHDKFKEIPSEKLLSYAKSKSVVYDVKNFLPKKIVDGSL